MSEINVQVIRTDARAGIIIRPLEKKDLPALEWDGEYIHFRNVFADVYKKVQNDSARAWVAVDQNDFMIGQVFLQLCSTRVELANGWDRAYLYSLRVKPQYQNKGIGSRLIHEVESTLLNLGYTELTLNVARKNKDAIRLYIRLGFKIVAEEPGVWSFPDHKGVWRTITEPSWRMEKDLVL